MQNMKRESLVGTHVKKVIALCSVFLVLAAGSQSGLAAAGLEYTALDRYVHQPDSNYKYQVINTIDGEGYTTYIIEMTSQQWLTEAEVNLPIWEHIMIVTRPDTVSSNTGFLYITGGDKFDEIPVAAPPTDIRRAIQSQTVVTTLFMVPNQPLMFVGDDSRQRSEDETVAYTWDKYLRTGDEKWPLRLPMTKSAVRAMDTITSLMADDNGNGIDVDRFVVAGGSKRGWTTWTTAVVDAR
ncbi:MAG: PhoPQ-activated protein PqaA family protein, partial [Pseudohongiellaceae bacterium]